MSKIQFDPDKLAEYASGLSGFIRQSEKFTESLRDVKEALDDFRNSKEHKYLFELRQMREDFNILVRHLEKSGMPGLDMYAEKLERIRPLLDDPDFPIAVDPDFLADTEESKVVRAQQILDFFVTEHIDGHRFLDYGCGEGYVVPEAVRRKTTLAIGYDIEKQWSDDVTNLTTDFHTVLQKAPFDIILLYDVLDHFRNPMEELVKVRNLLSPRGKVYLRAHPWCGKHGGHLYKVVNKAYIHVLFDEVEQMRIFGTSANFVQKLVDPISAYRDWFWKAGFGVVQESPIRDKELPPFFTNMDNIYVQERVAKYWKGVDPRKYLTLNFVNYILEPLESHKQIL